MTNPTETLQHSGMTEGAFAVNRRGVDDRVCVVSPDGEIDLATAPALKAALLESLHEGYRDVIVDLSGVSHMDSTGLGVLVAFHRRLDGHGRLAIAAIQRAVLTIFEITGIGAKFDTFATVDEAIARAHDTPQQEG
jgi:anti-sigma B factor antagonist